MYDETKPIEKQIAELLEAHQAKTGTSIVRIGIAWTSLSIATKEQKVRAVNIDAQTDILNSTNKSIGYAILINANF